MEDYEEIVGAAEDVKEAVNLKASKLSSSEYQKAKNFYNWNRFLIALHQCGNHIPFMTESTVIFDYFTNSNTHAEEISFIPGKNYYIFK